jgi:uncharacterized LabA/DUF88 family protein
MTHSPLCRIGVFYDGSYVTYAQNYFYKRQLGWLVFNPIHALLQQVLRHYEPSFTSHRVVYAGWYQGLFTTSQADERQLRVDRNRQHDLIHAGIEPKYSPMSQANGEKGVDVALAIDAIQIALSGTIDVAVLVTGDGDFVPLVRALTKHGVRVLIAYFKYEDDGHRSFANGRLLNAASYALDLTALEHNPQSLATFQTLFRR